MRDLSRIRKNGTDLALDLAFMMSFPEQEL